VDGFLRALTVSLLSTCLIAFIVIALAVFPPPSRGARQVALRLAELVEKPGIHEVYVPGIVEFRENRIIVEVWGERAEVEVSIELKPSAGSGYIKIYSSGSSAWIANP